jgi:hypothetical protein
MMSAPPLAPQSTVAFALIVSREPQAAIDMNNRFRTT